MEIGVVDGAGAVLFQSLINPGMPIPSAASAVHGMTDDMVRDAPAVDAVAAALRALLIADGEAVIYNAEFDCRFFASRFCDGISVTCAMLRHRDESGRSYKLGDAARHVGHVWGGGAHRAVADAMACRSVWRSLEKRSHES
ncbi:MAG TPA: 3'-5' exonuclease [Acetobacteraceae bacterium]|nr:3'-5' exonuclease [Acetobacteraceae bacterium]